MHLQDHTSTTHCSCWRQVRNIIAVDNCKWNIHILAAKRSERFSPISWRFLEAELNNSSWMHNGSQGHFCSQPTSIDAAFVVPLLISTTNVLGLVLFAAHWLVFGCELAKSKWTGLKEVGTGGAMGLDGGSPIIQNKINIHSRANPWWASDYCAYQHHFWAACLVGIPNCTWSRPHQSEGIPEIRRVVYK